MQNVELPFLRKNHMKKEEEKFYRELNKYICQNENSDNIYYQFGYEAFGIILYGFSKWLIKNLKKENIKDVFFLSRDGYIMKKAFELLPESKEFKTNYLYVSRRSLRVPSIWFSEKRKKETIFPTKYISINDLIMSIGLNADNYQDVIQECGLQPEQIIKEDQVENKYEVMKLLDEIWDDVLDNSIEEYNNLREYLVQFNMPENIAIVDIGWRGSMQFFLRKILEKMGKGINIKGYYITLSTSHLKGMDMYGYLQDVDGYSKGCDLLRGYVGLIEMMFLMSEGSVQRYKKLNGKVIPILEDYEYANSKEYADRVMHIQQGAIDFIKGIECENSLKDMSFTSEAAFTYLNEVGNHPTMDDINRFGDFPFFNNGTVSLLVQTDNLTEYIKNPKKAKQDLYKSRWRIGFLRQLFKINLPYYTLFKIMMKAAM